jgi:hypothetical protein
MEDVMTADPATRAAWQAIEKLYVLKKLAVDEALIDLPRPKLSRDGVQSAGIVDFELAVTRWLTAQHVRLACDAWEEIGRQCTAAFYKALFIDVVAVQIALRWKVLNRYFTRCDVTARNQLLPGWTVRYHTELRLLRLRWERELTMWALRAQGREEAGVALDVAGGRHPSLQTDEHVSVAELAAMTSGTPVVISPIETRSPNLTEDLSDKKPLPTGDLTESLPEEDELSKKSQRGRPGVDPEFRNAAGTVFNEIRADLPNGRLNSHGWEQFAKAMDRQGFVPPKLYLNKRAQEVLDGSRYASTWRDLLVKGPRALVRNFKRRVYEYAEDVRKFPPEVSGNITDKKI